MEHSTIADMAGWRSLAIQLGLAAVGVFSFVMLFSFGGQLIVAPALLPVQWLVARNTDGWVAKAFSLLGSALLAEVVYLGVLVMIGESLAIVLLGAAVALAAAAVFYRTSQDRR
jgi:hypothetical protein